MNAARFAVRLGFAVTAALVVISVAQPGVLAQDGHGDHQTATPENSARTSAFVQVVRDATRRFQDPAVALAENYVPTFGCVTGSSEGAMGVHFVNFSQVFDNVLDPAHPEILLYEPLPNNRFRLTGADFLVLAA